MAEFTEGPDYIYVPVKTTASVQLRVNLGSVTVNWFRSGSVQQSNTYNEDGGKIITDSFAITEDTSLAVTLNGEGFPAWHPGSFSANITISPGNSGQWPAITAVPNTYNGNPNGFTVGQPGWVGYFNFIPVTDFTMRAAVFINYEILGPIGHVGWGFEVSPGNFWFGAKEFGGGVVTLPGHPNGVFIESGTEQQMLAAMATGNHTPGSGNPGGWPYDCCKYIPVPNPQPDAAKQIAQATRNWGYTLIGNNCMDDVYKVIKDYSRGNPKILPLPSNNMLPSSFFAAIPTPAKKIR